MKKSLFLLLVCSLFAVNAVAGNYIVGFNGNGPSADFADRVAAAGGTVTFQHQVLALVSGLDANGAAGIGKLQGVAEIQEDAELTLDVAAVDAEAAFDGSIDSPSNPTTASFYPRQWHLRQIGAHTAWAAGILGSSSVRVAIL